MSHLVHIAITCVARFLRHWRGRLPRIAIFSALLFAACLLRPAPLDARPAKARSRHVPKVSHAARGLHGDRPSSRASLCFIRPVDLAKVERALAALARRPRSRRPSRLWGLLPNRIMAGGKQSISNGAGLTTADDASSLRWLAGDRRGWSVRVSWDLTSLWQVQRPKRMTPLAHALLVDRVATRLAAAVKAVGVARAAARRVVEASVMCGRLRAEAGAAVLRLRALLAAARAIRHG